VESRRKGFDEVELTFSAEDAQQEAARCLRCDLEFTSPAENNVCSETVKEQAI
jgi:NADPH-dependent glutamate synthase beta subunit-like oxidoreductase